MSTVPALRPADQASRAVRALLVGATVAGCAATAHGWAGGILHPFTVVLVAAGATLLAGALAGRRLGSSQLLGLLVLGQVAFHALSPALTHDATMVGGHAVATVVSLVLVSRAESAWWRLAEAALRWLPAPRITSVPQVCLGTPVLLCRPHAATAVPSLGGRAPPVSR